MCFLWTGENIVEVQVENTVRSRKTDGNDVASVHSLVTDSNPLPINAQKNTDTLSNNHKDKKK